MKIICCLLLSAILFASCNQKQPGLIDEKRLMNRDPKDWLTLGGNYLMQHYSPLDKINTTNVTGLGFAWEYNAGSTIGNVSRGLEATPIVVDGIMYTSGAYGFVYALDAKTGKETWIYDPNVDASYGRRACCDVVNRGVAVWKGKVYVGTLDGFMICLDAKTGRQLWRKDSFTDRTKAYTITGPPQVAGNIVMIGNSGAEYGVRGYITAYDLETGEQKWRFFTVPGKPSNGFEHPEMEMASKTWDPNSDWEAGGGGTSWGESAYDPQLNLLYVGTGNSTPYPVWYRSPNGGDNLFLSSILAINPDNGKLVWHYQTTPQEIWDFTATMNIVLADMTWQGKTRKVLMQAPKNGFFYVLDRATGELLSAEKFSRVNWASSIDLKTGRPVLTGQGWYKDTPKIVLPSLIGGHNWQPMSFNPNTGLVYIPEHAMPAVYEAIKNYKWKPDEDNTAINYSEMAHFSKVPWQVKEKLDTVTTESLLAWNPLTQKPAWKVEGEETDGGTMSSGNLVFQGTRTGYLKVYDAKTGTKLKEIFTGTGIMASPVTYTIDGEQYVAVMAGYGGAPTCCYPVDAAAFKYKNTGRIIAFKIGGGAVPLPPLIKPIPTPEPPDTPVLKEELIKKGLDLFYTYCQTCHGDFGDQHFSLHPDLSKLTLAKHQLFEKIVLGGMLASNGMASFSNSLDKENVECIHQYLLSKQKQNYSAELRKK